MFIKRLMILSAFGLGIFQLLSASSYSQSETLATFRVIVEKEHVQTVVPLPPYVKVAKKDVAFRIINNIGRPIFFQEPDGNYIPVVSRTTVTAPFSCNEYKVVDKENKTVASWHLCDPTPAMPTTLYICPNGATVNTPGLCPEVKTPDPKYIYVCPDGKEANDPSKCEKCKQEESKTICPPPPTTVVAPPPNPPCAHCLPGKPKNKKFPVKENGIINWVRGCW